MCLVGITFLKMPALHGGDITSNKAPSNCTEKIRAGLYIGGHLVGGICVGTWNINSIECIGIKHNLLGHAPFTLSFSGSTAP